MPGNINMYRPWWHGKFRGRGYRLTTAREAIVDVLNNTRDHLSAEEVYFAVHKKYPGIGLTTVYRTLELLVQLGMVLKFDFGDNRARYELAVRPKGVKHHHHLICTSCGKVIDYTDFIDDEIELLSLTEKGLSKKFDFEIKSHLIQFYGICKKCREKK